MSRITDTSSRDGRSIEAPEPGSSPACYLAEVDPAYLGYLDDGEVRALLDAVLDMRWNGPAATDLRRRLLAHRAALRGPDASLPAARASVERLRDALPRIHDDDLHRTLRAALAMMEGGPGDTP